MKEEKKTWYWVTGNEKKGFRIVTKQPRTRIVAEPFETRKAANISIAMYFLENA